MNNRLFRFCYAGYLAALIVALTTTVWLLTEFFVDGTLSYWLLGWVVLLLLLVVYPLGRSKPKTPSQALRAMEESLRATVLVDLVLLACTVSLVWILWPELWLYLFVGFVLVRAIRADLKCKYARLLRALQEVSPS